VTEHRTRHYETGGSNSAGAPARRVVERDDEQILFSTKRYNGDELRCTFSYFEGKPVVQLRDWYERDGKWLPGKKGIALPPRELAAIASALETALEKIERDGHPVRREERDPL